jgi:hypothetical protein
LTIFWGGGGGSGQRQQEWLMVWLISPTAYGFLMISPNLHDIWAMFFLFLPQELKLVLLLYFGTFGDGYSL